LSKAVKHNIERRATAIREALGPFGLDLSSDRWTDAERLFRKCAERYIFIQENQGQLPRPDHVARQLESLATAAKALASALENLNSIALEWLFANQEPAYRRSLARSDFDAQEQIRRLRDHVFGPDIEMVTRSHPQYARPPAQAPDVVIERIIAGQKKLIRWRNLAERNPSSAIAKGLEQAELGYAVALAALPEPELQSPDPVRVEAARRNHDLAALALQAHTAFSSSSPQDSGGPSPLFGAPTTALARDCANIILTCFGLPGFKYVVSTKEGKFHKLLIAVHEYAMGQTEPTPDFSGALKWIVKWRKERLAELAAQRFPDNDAIQGDMSLLEAHLGTRMDSSRRAGR
jgi:hypothetical protein